MITIEKDSNPEIEDFKQKVPTKVPTKVVIDTNILIDHPEILNDKSLSPVIPYMVLSELDNLKRNPDLKRSAQQAIKLLYNGIKEERITVTNIPTSITTPDEKIIKAAKKAQVPFMSNDIGAKAIAMSRNVKLIEAFEDETINYNYTGYFHINADLNYENDTVPIKEMQKVEFENKLDVKIHENEYCIVDRVSGKSDIWVCRNDRVKRISQSMKPFRDAGIMDSPLDPEQMCALHSVMDNEVPLTVISGEVGTGKTILSLMSAIACVNGQKRYMYYDKIYVTRPPISINNNMKLGYLPGTLSEKLGDWMGGIQSNLKFLLEKNKKDADSELASTIFQEKFDLINIDSIQGMSLHRGILLVDEFQLLDENLLKLILTRMAEGSKLVLIGDFENQTYGINRANEGYKVLLKHLGEHPEMSFIKLKNIYRSSLTKFVASIYKD